MDKVQKLKLYININALTKPSLINNLDELYKKNFYLNMHPQRNVVAGINKMCDCKKKDIEVYIIAKPINSVYAKSEINSWLDTNLPFLPKDHRIFIDDNNDQLDINDKSVLLDSQNESLIEWESKGGVSVKLVFDEFEEWKGEKIDSSLSSAIFYYTLKNKVFEQCVLKPYERLRNV